MSDQTPAPGHPADPTPADPTPAPGPAADPTPAATPGDPLPDIAVVVTVYAGVAADDLAVCLGSLLGQTRPAGQTVIVADGPLTPALDGVVDRFHAAAVDRGLTCDVVRLPRNLGAAGAANAGIARCDRPWIARLDADDAATPERFAVQAAYLDAHPGVTVLGTALHEFDGDAVPAPPRDPATGGPALTLDEDALRRVSLGVRPMPADHAGVARTMRTSSPVNNPSVVMRRDAVVAAGGYGEVRYMEDYDLWAHLLSRGARFANLPEPLTWFRMSRSTLRRRTAPGMFAAEKEMQTRLVRYGVVGRRRAIFNLGIRSLYRALPGPLLRLANRVLAPAPGAPRDPVGRVAGDPVFQRRHGHR
ncbi:glycosyltransferase [Corynebacterium bovis]|uniref:glycosyltransferase n=1 Tax=Corynebacterium bovis TaxID=36808 RepID=UPI0031398D1A